nr:hypothetical protein [Rathayibacter sp. AY1D7]
MADFTELVGGTQSLSKKLFVKSRAFAPAAESIAGVVPSSSSSVPSASNSQLSQRGVPPSCQL